jgi:hypothetical protein
MSACKKSWAEVSKGAISMASIRELHCPPENYRFTKDGYRGKSQFTGAMAFPMVIYVLEGEIKYTVDGVELPLKAGELAEFSPGSYKCDVPKDKAVSFIRVSLMPEKLRKSVADGE